MNKKLIVIGASLLSITTIVSAQDLIQNGNFSSGNTGFTSDYVYTPYNYTDYTQTPQVVDGAYTVGPYIPPSFPDWAPYQTVDGGNAQMMIVNGAASAAKAFWAQTVAVTPNTTYNISFYATPVANPSSNPDVAFNVNSGKIYDATLQAFPDNWVQYSFAWNSGSSTSANLSMIDLNTAGASNDFAVDNVSMIRTVPEPSTFGLLALSAPLCSYLRKRKIPK